MRLTAGGDATGLTITDFDLSYTRSGAATAAKADATDLGSASAAHTDNGGYEVDPTDCPGLHRFDFPDAAFAAGVREVILTVKHTSCFTESLRVEIDAFGAPAGATLAADIAAVKTDSAAILVDTGTTGVVVAAASKGGYALSATGGDLVLKTSTFALAMADAIWDEPFAGHISAGIYGKLVQDILADTAALGKRITLTGTANAGDSTTQITLTGGVATNGYYNGQLVVITGGTGIGQSRTILNYLAAGTVATPTRDWAVAPDGTSTFIVLGNDVPSILEAGVAQAGGAATITLDATASTTVDIYKNNFIMITGGTGAGQTRLIGAYSAARVATVLPNWTTNPDATSIYQVLPAARVDVQGWGGNLITGDGDWATLQTAVDAVLVDTGTTLPATLAAIQADLPIKITKNAAFTNFMFKMVDATNGYTAETGVSVTATRSLDGAAFGACANAAAEVASGWYKIDLDAADLNGDEVVLRFTGSGCRVTEFKFPTQAT
jgi:hypothetical protein